MAPDGNYFYTDFKVTRSPNCFFSLEELPRNLLIKMKLPSGYPSLLHFHLFFRHTGFLFLGSSPLLLKLPRRNPVLWRIRREGNNNDGAFPTFGWIIISILIIHHPNVKEMPVKVSIKILSTNRCHESWTKGPLAGQAKTHVAAIDRILYLLTFTHLSSQTYN